MFFFPEKSDGFETHRYIEGPIWGLMYKNQWFTIISIHSDGFETHRYELRNNKTDSYI